MWWRWRRHGHRDPGEPARVVKARELRRAKERELRDARSQWPEVRRLAHALRDERDENRFAERIRAAMRGQGDAA